MTEKTTRQIENLKNQTIGVEIEMNNITREDAAKIAAEYFGDPTSYANTAHRKAGAGEHRRGGGGAGADPRDHPWSTGKFKLTIESHYLVVV